MCVFSYACLTFCACDLDLGILKRYIHTKDEVSKSRLSKMKPRQTETRTHVAKNMTTPHSRVLFNPFNASWSKLLLFEGFSVILN